MQVAFEVNGKQVEVRVEPRLTLADSRRRLDLRVGLLRHADRRLPVGLRADTSAPAGLKTGRGGV